MTQIYCDTKKNNRKWIWWFYNSVYCCNYYCMNFCIHAQIIVLSIVFLWLFLKFYGIWNGEFKSFGNLLKPQINFSSRCILKLWKLTYIEARKYVNAMHKIMNIQYKLWIVFQIIILLHINVRKIKRIRKCNIQHSFVIL